VIHAKATHKLIAPQQLDVGVDIMKRSGKRGGLGWCVSGISRVVILIISKAFTGVIFLAFRCFG
jgi:hypothetical protein